MKQKVKRLNSLFLSLALMLALFSGNVLAEETEQYEPDPEAEVIVLDTVTKYNPDYEGVLTHEQIDALEEPGGSKRGLTAAAGTPQYATTPAEAGAQLRSCMKACQTSFSVFVRVTKSVFDEYGAEHIESKTWYEAIKITTNGREGDYLKSIWLKQNHSISYSTSEDGNYVFITIDYSFTYNTNAEYERKMVAYADELIGDFGFTRQTSAYDKIQTIYDYVITNIRYTSAENIDLPLYHTAYSAIVLKDTVCQGYATLLYYMFWRCGIPCRYVNGNHHAWNIVWLRGQWYSLDATWDRGTTPNHEFFLRGRDTGFYGDGTNNTHLPEGSNSIALVNSTYPYDYGAKRNGDYGTCTTHYNAASTYLTDDGYTCYWCSACGQSAIGSFNSCRIVDSGRCGDSLSWELDSNGNLRVDGSGDMWDSKIIWYPHRNCILWANLSDQITSIGSLAFDNEDYLWVVYLPQSLTRIGEKAFRGCDDLTRLHVYGNVSQIESNAFASCNSLEDVFYVGTPAQWNAITIDAGNECLTSARRHYACTVTYYPNGASGETYTEDCYTDWTTVLDDNSFIRPGYVFTGWNTKADGSGTAYTDGQIVTLTSDLILYSQWREITEITNAGNNGDTAWASIHCKTGQSAKAYGARYDREGKFLGVETWTLSSGDNELSILRNGAYTVRFFVLNNNGVPLCAAAEIPQA